MNIRPRAPLASWISFFPAILLCFCFLPRHGFEFVAGTCELRTCKLSDGKLLTVSYPFGAQTGCGASPDFVLQNCSTSSPYPPLRWPGFVAAMDLDHPYNISYSDAFESHLQSMAPPYVTGFWNRSNGSMAAEDSSSSSRSYVNITWKEPTKLSTNICEYPSLTTDLPSFLPSPIALDKLGFPKLITFSDYTYFLLLDCPKNPLSLPDVAIDTVLLRPDTTFCQSYVRVCGISASTCYELRLNGSTTLDLNLTGLAASAACLSFQMMVQTHDQTVGIVNGMASAGMLQLTWLNEELLQHCPTTNPDCNRGATCGTACKIALAVTVTVLAIALLLIILCLCRRHRLQGKRGGVHSRSIPSEIVISATNSSNKIFTERARNLSTRFGPVHVKEFSYQDLVKATDSFGEDNMIGDGGFGAVYLGVLKDGRRVAVKRLYHDNFRRMDQFYNEMKILSSFSHPNLVKLYGFCCEDDKDLLLVFEYASKGTVWDQLHGGGSDGERADSSKLPWHIRLRIAFETAEALSYLHNVVKPPIYHRDVKTSNILLDDLMHVKLADFGLSRLVPLNVTHVTTAPQGSPGYVDPDYHKCYQLTDKSDVYSFGVVLVELVSGKMAVDVERQRGEINLSSMALSKIACGRWKDLVDPPLRMSGEGGESTEEMVKGVLELAFRCLQEEKDDRPSMKEVSEGLEKICRMGGYDYQRSFVVQEETDETTKLMGNGGVHSTDAPSQLSMDAHSTASSLFGN